MEKGRKKNTKNKQLEGGNEPGGGKRKIGGETTKVRKYQGEKHIILSSTKIHIPGNN